MAAEKLKKHLPKRAMNANLKVRRAASWRRGEAKKAHNRAANEARHQANLAALAKGELTPAGIAKRARRAAR